MRDLAMSKDLLSIVSGNVSKAYEIAREIGKIIGIVSRRATSRAAKEENKVIIEVKPDIYYSLGLNLNLGTYLVAVDIRTLKIIGLRVHSIHRQDIASDLQVTTTISLEPEPEGLLTNVFIESTPLLTDSGEPFGTAIEPQSPVVLPSDPSILSKLIGIPSEGIVVGFLHTGTAPVAGGLVPLRIPRREFFKHLLILGTTGSGKTTFIKNLMYSIMNSWYEASLVVIDAAGDYTQILLPPPEPPNETEVFKKYLRSHKYPNWVTVLVPLRKKDTDLKYFAINYVKDRLLRIANEFHGKDLEFMIESTRGFDSTYSVVIKVMMDNWKGFVEVVPISLSYNQIRDHLEIFPLFSRQAKIFLRNVINYLDSLVGGITNFTYLYRVFQERSNELMRALKIHKGTLENIERALNFIASSEEVDVIVGRMSIGMPSIDSLMSKYRGPIVLDLDYAAVRGAHFIVLNLIA
ncbi:MAG TPA: ATP-binding protein, partial [Acidilobales archaeon]|nr:ATP-binding protein [Acidilobales archaeon]